MWFSSVAGAFYAGAKNSFLHGLKFYLKVSEREKIWHKLALKLQLLLLNECVGHVLNLGAC